MENDPAKLLGRSLREAVIDPDTGEELVERGTVITAELAERLSKLPIEQFRVQPYVSQDVQYLSADEEEHYVVAQANSPLDELGQFATERVAVRVYDSFMLETVDRVNFMDVSPKQVVGISAALIPFLEHDDANRALMGSNMQRQAVPLLTPEAPVVGTGMEYSAALDSGQVVLAGIEGQVVSVNARSVTIQGPEGVETHRLRKYDRTNQSTCIDQHPVVNKGDRVKPGDVLADSSSTELGELALGQNVLCAFLSWEGGNYEDAIVVSERFAQRDSFSSVHIEKHEIEARDTKLGPEEITRDIPNVGEDALANLDDEGIIYVGASVGPGDILVGKITPKGETELTPEEKLLRAIFGEKAREVKDLSLRLPHGEQGKVVDVRVFTRDEHRDLSAGVQKLVRVSVAQRRKLTEGDKMAGRHGNKGVISSVEAVEDMPYLEDGTPIDIILNPLGVPSRMNVGQVLETHLGWAADRLGFRVSTPVSDGATESEIAAELARAWLIDRAWLDLNKRMWDWVTANEIATDDLRDDNEVREMFLGTLLSSRGMADEDIERILTSRVASRRTWLELWLEEQGQAVVDVMLYEGTHLDEEQRERLDDRAREVCLRCWLRDEGVNVDTMTAAEVDAKALAVSQERNLPLPTTGKVVLYDGKSGEPFDLPVTVGIHYMLKLSHLVQDKVHARSTGPYSLVTQQPLGGKAQFGGQRFGEMEVWALEAYGAAHTLQEMLTIKSDDVTGRVKTYEAIVKGEPITESGVPESFRVLIKELQGLGLSVQVEGENGERVEFGREDTVSSLPNLGMGMGMGLGFGPVS
jgi:DNA-directed RNA polymerase subunit beta